MSCLLCRDDPLGRLYSRVAPPPSPASDLRPARAYRLALVAICTAGFLFACGVQGPPRPPRIERPERVSDLVVAQTGQTFEISFTSPTQAVDGERLTKPVEVQIFRSITTAGQKPQDTAAMEKPWVSLMATELSRYASGQKIVYTARLSEQEFNQGQGGTYKFALRALTRGFRHRPVESELSNVVETTLLDVSGPVEGLAIKTTEKALELSWSPPNRSLGNRPLSTLSGYRIYRGRIGKTGSYDLLGETNSAAYHDREFLFDRTYYYKVRALFTQNGHVGESEDSQAVDVTPHDVFPPAAPTGLTAVYAAEVVELIWSANTEPDLAGYNVYRREKQNSPQRLNPELLRTPICHDSSVEPGHNYVYRVTSVDLANNESSPSEEVTVKTE